MIGRREEIYREMRDRAVAQTHRTFLWLFAAQWAVAIAIALIRSPWTWHGAHRAIHPHVYFAVGLGGVLCSAPALLIHVRPTHPITRHVVAAAQALWSALLILVAGGRIEAHFHVFGSLAFLAMYRDWKVLVTATLTIVADHLARGLAWPDSVYGIANPEWWRVIEHAAWIAFEDVILAVGCARATREMRHAALHEAVLEQSAATIQRKVENRTRQLHDNAERYRLLVENTEAIPFEYDATTRRLVYIAPRAAALLEYEASDLAAEGFFAIASHPLDRDAVCAAFAAFTRGERAAGEPIDHRMRTRHGRTLHVRTFLSSRTGPRVRGIVLDMTRQTLLESELRQAQKLESVGRLAAGVAHEINTPIQFVSDSLQFTRDAIGDLLALVCAQQAAVAAARAGAWSDAVDRQAGEALEQLDLAYLVEQLPRALDRALDGTSRVATIVKSMKVFSHDRREAAEVDLREAIESTLTIARAEYKYVADLELQLDPIPRVVCCGSEINQVILNIVINAAHAIGDVVAGTERRGKITVALRQDGDAAVISISDTGGGIPDHVREHLFEQFYTTKPVGKGTGQGLALCRAVVVDKHHGTLTFDTAAGVGTTFHVRIPIHPPASAVSAAG